MTLCGTRIRNRVYPVAPAQTSLRSIPDADLVPAELRAGLSCSLAPISLALDGSPRRADRFLLLVGHIVQFSYACWDRIVQAQLAALQHDH